MLSRRQLLHAKSYYSNRRDDDAGCYRSGWFQAGFGSGPPGNGEKGCSVLAGRVLVQDQIINVNGHNLANMDLKGIVTTLQSLGNNAPKQLLVSRRTVVPNGNSSSNHQPKMELQTANTAENLPPNLPLPLLWHQFRSINTRSIWPCLSKNWMWN